MTTLRRVAIALLVLLGLGTSLVVCGRIAERGRYAVPYSTHGAGPEGTRALFELARARGERPVRWAEDFARLPPRAMIIALGGCEVLMNREVSRFERETLDAWIERGGTLVVAGANGYLWQSTGVRLKAPPDCYPAESFVRELARAERGEGEDKGEGEPADAEDLERAFAEDPSGTIDAFSADLPPATPVFAVPEKHGLFDGLGAVPLVRPGRLELAESAEARGLLFHDGVPLAAIVEKGEGAIIVLASASPFQNQNLDSADGAVVFSRIVEARPPDGPILFDEYHLGVGERRSMMQYLRSVGATPFAIQLLVVIGFLVLRRGRRFGAPREEPEPPPAGTASYVGAVGSLYEKSGDARAALGRVVKHALGRIAAHHHLEAGSSEPLAKALDERSRIDEARAVRELAGLAGLPSRTSSELVGRLREVDALVARATETSRMRGEA
jgi:hypothetical protein